MLAADPLCAEAHQLLCRLLVLVGDLPAARQALERALFLVPDDVLAHVTLATIHRDEGRHAAAARSYRNALRLLQRLPADAWLGEFQADALQRACLRGLSTVSQ